MFFTKLKQHCPEFMLSYFGRCGVRAVLLPASDPQLSCMGSLAISVHLTRNCFTTHSVRCWSSAAAGRALCCETACLLGRSSGVTIADSTKRLPSLGLDRILCSAGKAYEPLPKIMRWSYCMLVACLTQGFELCRLGHTVLAGFSF